MSCIEILMNDMKYSNSEDILFTKGLGGCFAIVIYTKNQKFEEGILIHGEPLYIENFFPTIIELLITKTMKLAEIKKIAIFHINENQTEFIKKVLKSNLGENIKIVEIMYSRDIIYGNSFQGEIIYKIKDGIVYHENGTLNMKNIS